MADGERNADCLALCAGGETRRNVNINELFVESGLYSRLSALRGEAAVFAGYEGLHPRMMQFASLVGMNRMMRT